MLYNPEEVIKIVEHYTRLQYYSIVCDLNPLDTDLIDHARDMPDFIREFRDEVPIEIRKNLEILDLETLEQKCQEKVKIQDTPEEDN